MLILLSGRASCPHTGAFERFGPGTGTMAGSERPSGHGAPGRSPNPFRAHLTPKKDLAS